MKLNKIVNRWVALGVSLVGIIALLILQFVWLTNAYEVSEQNLKDKCKLHLKAAIEKEMFMRANNSSLKMSPLRKALFLIQSPKSYYVARIAESVQES